MTTPLRTAEPAIALYASSASNRGGTGVYTERLIQGFRDAGIKGVVPVGSGSTGAGGKLLGEHFSVPRAVKRGGFDLLHLPAFGGRPVPGIPYAVTVHDMAFMTGPGWFPLLRSIYYRLHFPAVARGASMIIADSDFTSREIMRHLGLSSVRVYLSSPCNSSTGSLFRSKYSPGGRYIICTGTIEPRKNIEALLLAWPGVRSVHSDLTLVVAGRWGWGDRRIRDRLLSEKGVRWVGSIPGEDLNSATAGAELLVYPSLYEGFGLPPLEAAAAGVPFVIGPAETLREIYSEVASGICTAEPDSIRRGILEALDSPRDPEALRSFAGGFSMETMARNTWNCYRKVLNEDP